MTRLAAILLIVLPLAASARAQNSIVLRPSARIDPAAAITLEEVAAIEGPDAATLGVLEVLPAGDAAPRELSVEDLRRTLARRVNWSQATLSGSTCRLLAAPAPAPAPQPAAAHNDAAPEAGTLRHALTARLAQILQAAPHDLRITFADADADLLNLPTIGRTVELKVIGSAERLSLALTVYEHDRIIASRTIRAGVLIRREVLIASAAKRRGDTISEADFTIDHQWLAPSATPAPRERVIGAAVKGGRLNAGEMITDADLAPATVVAKGDQVVVRCLAGTVVVSTRARAMAAAREGEIVQLQGIENPDRIFSARMDGRGRAVLLSTQPAKGRKARTP